MHVWQGTPVAGTNEARAARRKVKACRQAPSSRPTPGGLAQQAAAPPTHSSLSPAAPVQPLNQAEEANMAADHIGQQVGQGSQLPQQDVSPVGAEARHASASRAGQTAAPPAHAASSPTAPMQALDQAEEAGMAAGHTMQQIGQARQPPGQDVAPEGAEARDAAATSAEQAAAPLAHAARSPTAPMQALDQAGEAGMDADHTGHLVGPACQLARQNVSPEGAEARDAGASRAEQAAAPPSHEPSSLAAPFPLGIPPNQAEEADVAANHTVQQAGEAGQLPGQSAAPESAEARDLGTREVAAETEELPREATALQGSLANLRSSSPAGPPGHAASPSSSPPIQTPPAEPECPSDGHAGLPSVPDCSKLFADLAPVLLLKHC